MERTQRHDYERVRDRAHRASRERSRSSRDIGAIPPVSDRALRSECDASLKVFAERLFPMRFKYPWSKNHLEVLDLTQDTIERGGRVAVALSRGEGKTSIGEVAVLWATLTARHVYGLLIAASAGEANEILTRIQAELMVNDRLASVYPGVCYPIQCLEGETRRCRGQLHHGRRTHIEFGKEVIRYPFIPGEPAAGAAIRIAGIEGGIRGRLVSFPDGRTARPSIALIDDVQTRESAYSPTQTRTRRRTIEGDIAYLGGPDHSVSMVNLCTVIGPNDLADEMLDRKRSPEWRGIRKRFVEKFPENDELWGQYDELRVRSLAERNDISLATEFYAENREAMDQGAVVAWEHRYERGNEISAIQHAMNKKLADEVSFWAEYQNEPLDENSDEDAALEPAEIQKRVSGLDRRTVPAEAEFITAGVDVQKRLLFWTVIAWTSTFDGWVIDYGAYPDQKRRMFTLRDAKRTLGRAYPGRGVEGALLAGLGDLATELMGREYQVSGGATMPIDLCLVDANWQTEIVHQLTRAHTHAARIMPMRGRFYGASSQPIGERKKQRGDRMGLNWYIPGGQGRKTREVVFDTNWWKTFMAGRLIVPQPRGIQLFGGQGASDQHRMFTEQLTAEHRVSVEGRGRRVDEWKLKRPGLDNHYMDTTVAAAVAASIRGAKLEGHETPGARKRKRVSMRELKEQRRAQG